eukprot:TRINITY_DN3130_c0_g1_i2.p1 TRINITY_DN3130_c0_g1~~TRINITY_DN3130_c0_g1_i2.p1  ORF type:complete len:472 (-),score=78.04 TRINITY_DN3130_c0_g1_i2:209-1624(-)
MVKLISLSIFLLLLHLQISSSKITLSLSPLSSSNESRNRGLRATEQGEREGLLLFKTKTEHAISVKVGQPPRTLSLVVDTGSAQVAVPLEGCNCSPSCECGQQVALSALQEIQCENNTLCSKKMCSASRPSLCGFRVSYGDSSAISGVLVSGLIQLGKISINATFGGLFQISSRFASAGADGVLGLAPGGPNISCAPNCVKPFYDLLVERTSIRNIFSINMTTNGNGTLTLGGIEEGIPVSSIVYSPLVSNQFYMLTLQKLMIGDISLNSAPLEATVDSGTTYLMLTSGLWEALKSSLLNNFTLPRAVELFQPSNGNCLLDNGTIAIDKYPNLKLALAGVQIELTPQQYFVRLSRNGLLYRCFTILALPPTQKHIILGGSVFSAYYTIFDRENKRIGFAGKRNSIPAQVPTEPPSESSGPSDGQKAAVGIIVILLAAIIIGGAVYLFLQHRASSTSYKRISASAQTQILYD